MAEPAAAARRPREARRHLRTPAAREPAPRESAPEGQPGRNAPPVGPGGPTEAVRFGAGATLGVRRGSAGWARLTADRRRFGSLGCATGPSREAHSRVAYFTEWVRRSRMQNADPAKAPAQARNPCDF